MNSIIFTQHNCITLHLKMPVVPQFSLLKEGLLHLFYPRLCAGCYKSLAGSETVLCIGCERQLPETGHAGQPDNDAAIRLAGRIPFQYAASLAWFTDDGLLQILLHGLKYGGRKDIGVYLGQILGTRLKEAGWHRGVDMIIPVPLHPAKEAARGFNQSYFIGKGISAATGIPVHTDMLVRTRKTESQTRKTRIERVNNMAGAFRINGAAVAGEKHILLVDDTLTTGATLEACAMALMYEKSLKISVATIGIAVT